MEDRLVIKAFAALAHPMRLKIFRVLVIAGHGGMTPTAIVQQLGLPAATLSFHLKELNHAGLVTQEREGRSLIYRAAYDQMDALIAFMKHNCCAGLPAEATALAACAC